MKKFLAIVTVLAATAAPALAQSATTRNAVVKVRTQIEQSVPGQSFADLHAGGGF
jgi:hypothetical protein